MPMGKLVRVAKAKPSAKSMASKALREVSKLRQTEELKFMDTFDTSAATTSWSLVGNDYLNLAQGATATTRVGEAATLESVHIRGDVRPALTNEQSSIARVVVYYTEDDTALTLPDPMESDSVYAFRDLSLTGKVRILWDRTFVLAPAVSAAGVDLAGTKIIPFEKHIKLRKVIRYETGSSIPVNGKLAVIWITDQATLPPLYNGNVRIRYRG